MLFLLCCASTVIDAGQVGDVLKPTVNHQMYNSAHIRPNFNHPESITTMSYLDGEQKKSGRFVVYPCRKSNLYFVCLEAEVSGWMDYFLDGDQKESAELIIERASHGGINVLKEQNKTAFGLFGHDDVFARSELTSVSEDVDTEGSKTFQEKMVLLGCNAMLVAHLIKACIHQSGDNQKLADVLGVSSQQLSQLKQPLKYKINDDSPTVIKAWKWFMNTNVEEILSVANVSEDVIQAALEY